MHRLCQPLHFYIYKLRCKCRDRILRTMLQTETFLERNEEEELIWCYSNAQALNHGRGNDPWRMGILTHPHMTVENHAHLWSQHRKREALQAKWHKFNHLHCKSAQHPIFFKSLLREGGWVRILVHLPQRLDLLQDGGHQTHILLQEKKPNQTKQPF